MSNDGTNGNSRLDGWGEYQRLVLAELARHNDLILDTNRSLNEIKLRLALIEQKNKDLSDMLVHIVDREDKLETKVESLERTGYIDEALNKYRKWIVATGIMLVTSIIVPLVKLIFFPGS
jgi:hypothetical protein